MSAGYGGLVIGAVASAAINRRAASALVTFFCRDEIAALVEGRALQILSNK